MITAWVRHYYVRVIHPTMRSYNGTCGASSTSQTTAEFHLIVFGIMPAADYDDSAVWACVCVCVSFECACLLAPHGSILGRITLPSHLSSATVPTCTSPSPHAMLSFPFLLKEYTSTNKKRMVSKKLTWRLLIMTPHGMNENSQQRKKERKKEKLQRCGSITASNQTHAVSCHVISIQIEPKQES